MTRPVERPQASNGPPSQLISRINHLHNLLKNFPWSLPLDPTESCYSFSLDMEDVEEEGMWFT